MGEMGKKMATTMLYGFRNEFVHRVARQPARGNRSVYVYIWVVVKLGSLFGYPKY